MKKVLLTLVCLATSLVWGVKGTAQTTTTLSDGTHSAVVVKSADGSKLTVTADGDLKDLKCANGEKSFTANAVNNVFVDVNGTKTSVKAGDKYDDANSYFQASRTYSPLTIADENKKESKVYTFTQKAYDAPLYVLPSDLSDWSGASYTSIKGDDTPYKVGKYNLYGLYYSDNLKRSWDENTYFYILENGSYKNLSAVAIESDEYVTSATKTILVNLSDNVFKSTDNGNTFVAVSNGDVYDEAALYYIGGETTYDALADADPYTVDVVVSFAEYLPTLMEGVTSAKFTSKDAKNPSMIDNSITQALMTTKVRVLDLSGVKIDEIKTPFTNENASDCTIDATFCFADDAYKKNEYIETLYTPQVNAGGEIKWNVFGKLTKLRFLHLSEGIETLGVNAIYKNEVKLSELTFPNTLKYIRKGACQDHFQDKFVQNKVYDEATGKYDSKDMPWIQTLVFPAGLLEIESGAFGSTCPKDVYFLGVEAPKVAKFAFGDNGYLGNNAFERNVKDGEGSTAVEVNVETGEACRANYNTQNGWMMMLHYPRECTPEQAAKYTDLTRDYKRIDANIAAEDKINSYTPGKESEDLKGTGESPITQNVADKTFISTMVEGNYGGNYSGGYYDAYTKDQYMWPSISMAYRATVAAQNDFLWDGVTSIGDGIRNAGDASYSGDGSEYIGLHQFTLAKGDAESKSDTKKFPMDKYADGEWHTICLPFNITKGQMKEIFGRAEDDVDGKYENIRLCKFNKVYRVVGGVNDQLKLCFNDERFHREDITDDDVVLEAHVSYMIKAKKENVVDGNEVVMENYQMVPGNPIPTQIFGTANGGMQTHEDDDESDFSYRFIGTYLPNINMPQFSYFFSKTKKIFRFQGGTTGKWNPYTSVIEAPLGDEDDIAFFGGNGNNTNAKMYTALGEKFDEATGINNVTIEADGEVVYTNGNVYNLNGQLVSNHGTDGLQKGIYVVAGKKVLVK